MFNLFGSSRKRKSGTRLAKINRAKSRVKKRLKVAQQERQLSALKMRLVEMEASPSKPRKKKGK